VTGNQMQVIIVKGLSDYSWLKKQSILHMESCDNHQCA